jgi:hypothetical protein
LETLIIADDGDIEEEDGNEEEKEVILVSATPFATVYRLNGNQNQLTVTVTLLFSDKSEEVIEETILIDNNSDVIVEVGDFEVFISRRGNDQIREIFIIE